MAGQGEVNIVLFTGPLFIGCMLSYFLSGCSFVQAVYFFQTTPISKRYRYVITLVSLVSIADLAAVAILTVSLFHIFCLALPQGDLSFQAPSVALASPILNTFVAVSVQGHFALRIRRLSQESLTGKFVPILIVLMGLVQIGSTIAVTYLIWASNREIESIAREVHQGRVILVWFINAALADITITLTLVYLYWSFKKSTQSRQSKNWLNSLILHTVENGAITSFGVILHFAFYIAHPDNLLHIGIAYVVCRLYSNVLLASINSNRGFQREAMSHSESNFSLSDSPNHTTREGESGADSPRIRTTSSARRHSLSGALQRSARIGTCTETIEFTTINSSELSCSKDDRSEGRNIDGGGYWKNGTLTKE
ncbi:hypothetical protein FA13DRAFT_1776293 [Coprinellus micaceus]|uniref:DUF6534 domain-containing protein n=1 Tax=Coprinellus micaceus TaxID=71717 RepID=A0A4Y7T1D0_COPMI|nr:hypothetical protein FA13DRAFT_1776293 [Coprinellus micaceus]